MAILYFDERRRYAFNPLGTAACRIALEHVRRLPGAIYAGQACGMLWAKLKTFCGSYLDLILRSRGRLEP